MASVDEHFKKDQFVAKSASFYKSGSVSLQVDIREVLGQVRAVTHVWNPCSCSQVDARRGGSISRFQNISNKR